MKSAAPTLSEKYQSFCLGYYKKFRAQPDYVATVQFLQRVGVEAPPAAERTALKDLRKKVEALKEPYEWVEIGVSGARDYEHKYDVKTLNQVLSEIDAASASEGTKSE